MPVTNASLTAVETVYEHHHRWLVALLNKKAKNPFDAYDLAHDVFVLLLKKPRQFDSFEGTRNYLSALAHGVFVDAQRRSILEQAWQEAMALRPQAQHPSPEERLVILETLAEVAAMLERLPEKAAKAFLMVHLEGMRYREIAEHLQVSERMVKKYIAQAMLHCALLRNGMQPSDGAQLAQA